MSPGVLGSYERSKLWARRWYLVNTKMREHMSKVSIHLDEQLSDLRKVLLNMGDSVERSVQESVKSFKKDDIQLANYVIQQDEHIDRFEVEIDEMCLKIIALKQPIAIDLRFVASSLKINNDLERIGDFASGIARQVLHLKGKRLKQPVGQEGLLYELGRTMLRESLRSFIELDMDLAREVIAKDEELDQVYSNLVKEVAQRVSKDIQNFNAGFGLMEIAKSFERIGDHTTNIAEQTIYLGEGEIIKHSY